ncbi:MAG: hypothetical protein HY706_02080 [Candidatus Hydrogenedentes bacterium]|nr:hypothetical protein [Candidatus Hydrogenedentota bacterium]
MRTFASLCYVLTGFSFLLIALSTIQGYLEFAVFGAKHAALGLVAGILYLATQTLVVFFFVGAGISVREYVRERGLAPACIQRMNGIKHKLYPPTMLNIMLVMIAFVSGGAADTKVIPAWLHGMIAVAAALHYAMTIRTQHRCFQENATLINELYATDSSE